MSTVFGQTIATDHRVVYELRDQYIAAPDVESKKEILKLLMWNIARHVTTEEILVHPLCENFLGSELGGKLAEFDGKEHAVSTLNAMIHMLHCLILVPPHCHDDLPRARP